MIGKPSWRLWSATAFGIRTRAAREVAEIRVVGVYGEPPALPASQK
jgi:hypothetical protein